jgi:hypothetical protein
MQVAYDASTRSENIDATLEEISSAVRAIRVVQDFPEDLAELQLIDVQCAAVCLCSAILSYVVVVIKYLGSSRISKSYLLLSSSYMLENITKTILRSEKAFLSGKGEISSAIQSYNSRIAALHSRVTIETYVELKENGKQRNHIQQGRIACNCFCN